MPKYSLLNAHGSVHDYLNPSSELRKLIDGWSEQGYAVASVNVVKDSNDQDSILVTMQKEGYAVRPTAPVHDRVITSRN